MKRKSIFGILLSLLLVMCFSATPIFAEETDTSEAAATSKLVAITFDDGPGPYTAKLLDALKARNAHATFFLVGNRVSANASLVAREVNEGHQVGNHSWSHAKLTTLGGAAIANELNSTSAAISKAAGGGNFYFRPPYGSYNSTVKSYAGVPIILWSVDTLDWKYRNATTVKNNIVNGAKDGAIILLHDIHSTSVDGAIAAIDVLQSQGYECVTVAELMRRRGVTPTAGQVYASIANHGVDLPANTPYDDGPDFDETKLSSHWAYDAIQFVKQRGIFQGTSATTFSPDKYMTRGMFVTVLSRLSGEDLSNFANPFGDVADSQYYRNAVAWGVSKGLVKGTSATSFEPDAFVTREQMCVFLQRYAEYKGIAFNSNVAKNVFLDDGQISDYARDSVEKLQMSGLIKGVGDNRFEPQGRASRAQVATLCQSFVKAYIDKNS